MPCTLLLHITPAPWELSRLFLWYFTPAHVRENYSGSDLYKVKEKSQAEGTKRGCVSQTSLEMHYKTETETGCAVRL